jgi:serine/threonine protein phosphatase PrpC
MKVKPKRFLGEGIANQVALNYLSYGRINGATLSIRGKDHESMGLPNQDAVGLGISESGRYIWAVVADGVGSTFAANAASRIAVESILDVLPGSTNEFENSYRPENFPWQGLASVISERIKTNFPSAATTTEIFIFDNDTLDVVGISLGGDGSFLRVEADKKVKLISGFPLGYANEEPLENYLPDEARFVIKSSRLSSGECLILCTDGFTKLDLRKSRRICLKTKSLLKKERSLVSLIRDISRYNDDDLSFAAIFLEE